MKKLLAAVTIATWLIAHRYSKPLRLVSESMAEIGKGRFDYRIAENRTDEFGELYRAFDAMAESLGKIGYACDIALSGKAAVERMDKGGYEIVVTDLVMPGGAGGLEVDVVLCLGFLYHTLRYNELWHGIRQTGAQHLVLDTQAHGMFVQVGSLPIPLDDGRFANRSVLFGPDGTQRATYDKIHLFDADIAGLNAYRESATYKGGEQAVTAPLGQFTLGFSICYDMRFPRLYNALANGGANLIAVPAAFTVPTGQAHWHVLLRARAIETGSFVIAAAQGGSHPNGRSTYGHSLIIDPWGKVIAELDHDRPGVLVADIDPAAVTEARGRVPALANARDFAAPALQR